MPGYIIHLAVAHEYAVKNHINEKDQKQLYQGALDPDFVEDKSRSHYSDIKDESNLVERLKGKVSLPLFLAQNEIDSCYQQGIFLHLITDYLFFNHFFHLAKIQKRNEEEFINNLYYSYSYTNEYLIQKYLQGLEDIVKPVFFDIRKSEEKMNQKNVKNILELTLLDEFIEQVASIDLQEYREKIIKANRNVLP